LLLILVLQIDMRILILILCLFSGSAFSAMSNGFTPHQVRSIYTQAVTNNKLVSVVYRGRVLPNQPVYASRLVPVTPSGMRALLLKRAGSALFNPWLSAALLVGGYAYNSLSTQIEQPGTTDPNLAPEGFGYYVDSGNGFYSQTKSGACALSVAWAGAEFNINGDTCERLNNGVLAESHPIYLVPSTVSDGPYQFPDTPATPDQLNNFLAGLTAAQLLKLFINPSTLKPDDVPELNATGDDITSDYNAENDTNPDGSPDTTTSETVDEATGDNGVSTISDVPPEPEPVATGDAEEQKNLCELNPAILACQPLGDTPANQQIPEEQPTFSFAPESLSSNATCPAPANMNLSRGSFSFSYQPICDLAIAINPLFIAICSLVALYIVVGAVRD